MISILIPVHNTSVFKLVHDLIQQIKQNELQAEIIVFDDFSEDTYREQNQGLTTLPFVFYKELNKNHGRVEIRRLLASSAKYKWLLFIDGDSGIVNENYLNKFYGVIGRGFDVISGGRVYSQIPPDCSKILHWKYGTKRETIAINSKGRFHSNNFCIMRSAFQKLSFPEELTGYGHEDTWMGIQFELLNFKSHYIDNPVSHEGIESTEAFLNKTNNALLNLHKLSKLTNRDLLKKNVRQFNILCKLRYIKLGWFVLLLYKLTRKIVLKNLCSCNPSLLLFDWLRLGMLIEIEMKANRNHKKRILFRLLNFKYLF